MLPPITSLQNLRIKETARLRDKRGRVQQGRIIIDGLREIWRAIQAGVTEVELFVCLPLLEAERSQKVAQGDISAAQVLDLVGEIRARITPVSHEVMEKLAFGDRLEAVLATAVAPSTSLAALDARLGAGKQPGKRTAKPTEAPLLAVLEGLEKPGNVGAILRTADAAGVSGVLVAGAGTDLFNPATIRASLGAVFTLPIAVCTAQEAITWLRERKIQLLAAKVDGVVNYTDVDLSLSSALVLGSEAEGLSSVWSGAGVQGIRLPMRGIVDSLNVSVSAGVLFYEALRQRQSKRPV